MELFLPYLHVECLLIVRRNVVSQVDIRHADTEKTTPGAIQKNDEYEIKYLTNPNFILYFFFCITPSIIKLKILS